MKHLLRFIVFTFIALHTPAGHEIFISHDSVVAIAPGHGWCADGVTRLVTTDGTQCVTEKPDAIMKLLQSADPEVKLKRAGDAPEPPAAEEEE